MEPLLLVLAMFASVVSFVLLLMSFRTIAQGNVGVVTMFGKYRRVVFPGLNFLLPGIERVSRVVSVQHRSFEIAFQAITVDQANVYFKAMLLFSVLDQREETIVNVAFKFIDEASFLQTLTRSVEGAVRSFVATKRQAEVLALRSEIVTSVKHHMDNTLEDWGYHLIDLQMNDIVFDTPVMESMAKVVAAQNLLAAAENEGNALLVRKTKQAEAEGNAIRIAAEADRVAQQLRGKGISLFREEAARGMSLAAREMKDAGLSSSLILFQMWTEALKHVAENGRGNVMMLDGSTNGMERTLQQMLALQAGKGVGEPPAGPKTQ
jgi:regulator of protease activity HflC (stomatin/prohibitin superfamily)